HARERFVLELARREIDGEAEIGAALQMPRAHLPARRPEHPLADRHDRADLLRERDEVLRLHHPDTGTIPAQQRFESGDPSGLELELRLIDEKQLVALDRAAQRA